MSIPLLTPLPEPPRGFRYHRSKEEIVRSHELFAYQHLLLRAWEELELSGVLTLNGIPTVYVRDTAKPLSPTKAAESCRKLWNQGIATLFVLRDPQSVRVFSSMTVPTDETTATDADIAERVVERLDMATLALWAERFYAQLHAGHYYSAPERAKWFDPRHAVDAYLLRNLAAVRDALVDEGLDPQYAHAFIGRVLFTCYLCDRRIVELESYFAGTHWKRLHELLESLPDPKGALYDTLFPALQGEFNGSMFNIDLRDERSRIRPSHVDIMRRFLRGDDLARRADQPTLGFWAYDFKLIPVETISAIYESFLEGEDSGEKRASGAFYTPRFLAEMALERVLPATGSLYQAGRRFLDPACGSGIFLVLLFNRLSAEWRAEQAGPPEPQAQAEQLLLRLNALRGVDKSLTACRVACFSLYLAFLDTFDTPGVRAYKLHTGKKLPDLLRKRDAKRDPELPVIWEASFFDVADRWRGQFDIVIGNPPWGGRGKKQLAHPFMTLTPDLLRKGGRACLLLPSRVFLNRTDDVQSEWLRRVTLESVVQLADYSEILFQDARSSCCITVFNANTPDEATHEIEYVVPKFSRAELREGLIFIEPQDRKWISLRLLLRAQTQETRALIWKSHLWGTPRDLKLLDYLLTLPRLGEHVDILSETGKGRSKRWAVGQGCKPQKQNRSPDRELKPMDGWSLDDPFVSDGLLKGLAYIPRSLCPKLGEQLSLRGYITTSLYSKPDESLFTGPLILLNQGFSEFTFIDYVVRFQHALQSIAGPKEDTNALLFLLGYLRSKLARYFIFHTAANVATERDKAHLFEVMRLPFFLPGSEMAQPDADAIMGSVVKVLKRLRKEMIASAEGLGNDQQELELGPLFHRRREGRKQIGQVADKSFQQWQRAQREASSRAQNEEIDPLIFRYFGLTDQDRALVEDTCEIFDRSDTPGSVMNAPPSPMLEPLSDWTSLGDYAGMLVSALGETARGPRRIGARGQVGSQLGIAVVELSRDPSDSSFRNIGDAEVLLKAFRRLLNSSEERSGSWVFRRHGLIFDGPRIYVVKPALRGQWTRTAAINDAAELRARIAEAKRQAKQL